MILINWEQRLPISIYSYMSRLWINSLHGFSIPAFIEVNKVTGTPAYV